MTEKNTLRIYLDEAEKYPLLTKEESLELYKLAKNGDKKAREKLINHNLLLVIKIAKKYMASGIDLMDLIQQGNLGLIKAVDTWDPSLGALSTHATYQITASISRYCLNNQNTIRKPVWQQDLTIKIEKIIAEYIKKTGRKPSVEEIATMLDIYPETIERIYQVNAIKFVPLDAPISSNDHQTMTIADTIADDRPREIGQEKLKKAVQIALSYLDPEDADFMENAFSLNGKRKTLDQIAEERGVTKQAMSLKKQELLQKLRYPAILEAIRKEL